VAQNWITRKHSRIQCQQICKTGVQHSELCTKHGDLILNYFVNSVINKEISNVQTFSDLRKEWFHEIFTKPEIHVIRNWPHPCLLITPYRLETLFHSAPLNVKQSSSRSLVFEEPVVRRFRDNRHMKVLRLLALRTGRLSPRRHSWYSFLQEAESTLGQ